MILRNSAQKLKKASLTFDKLNELEKWVGEMSWSSRDRDCKNGNLLFKRRFRGRHRRGIFNSLLFYLFCVYFLFLDNLIYFF